MLERASVAKVLIINPNDEVLVLVRSEFKEQPSKSHKPDLPGGLVESDESERAGAVREAQEEAGIVLDLNTLRLGFAETQVFERDNKSITHLLYTTSVATTPEVTLSYEHESYEWVKLDEVLSRYTFIDFYAKGIRYITENRITL